VVTGKTIKRMSTKQHVSSSQNAEQWYPTVSGAVVRNALLAARMAGVPVDPDALLQRYAGIDWAQLGEDTRISVDLMYELVPRCAEHLQQPVLGLQLHRTLDFSRLPEVADVLAIAPDVRTAIHLLLRFYELVTAVADLRWVVEGAEAAIEFRPRHPERISYHQVDTHVVALLRLAQLLGGNPVLSVELAHACPDGCEQVYRDVLGSSVQFARPVTRLRFDAAWLDLALSPTNTALSLLARKEVRRKKLQKAETLSVQLRSLIQQTLVMGEPSRKEYADTLCLSERTLQRRLQEEGCSFSNLVEAARREQVQEYLLRQEYSHDRIAFLLGYREVRSFYRAFERWFQCTPGEYRDLMAASLLPTFPPE
jgi:AraC-like DNA-binding protein